MSKEVVPKFKVGDTIMMEPFGYRHEVIKVTSDKYELMDFYKQLEEFDINFIDKNFNLESSRTCVQVRQHPFNKESFTENHKIMLEKIREIDWKIKEKNIRIGHVVKHIVADNIVFSEIEEIRENKNGMFFSVKSCMHPLSYPEILAIYEEVEELKQNPIEQLTPREV